MKRAALLLTLVSVAGSFYGQDIIREYGLKEPLTLSRGRYAETFPNKETVQIGTVLLNTKTGKIVEFLEEDTTEYAYQAEYSTRWLSPDPLAEKYPQLSPYVFCANNPLKYIDPDGRELKIWYKDSNGKSQSFVFTGQNAQHSNSFVNAVITAYKYNKSNGERARNGGGASTVAAVERTDISINVMETEYGSQYEQYNTGGTLFWNPNLGSKTAENIIRSPASVFDHEADHAVDAKTNPVQHETNAQYGTDNQYGTKEERRVITGSEQKTARANGEIKSGQVTRTNHKGSPVITEGVTSTQVNAQKTQEYEKKEAKRPGWTSEW
ncbi:MAG: hypothetical protein LBJ63_11655 [Prevotellaceae bacterium]|jgi:hypothetical protein|nr:hypothetical protein [Prevotellaceae bacterium]